MSQTLEQQKQKQRRKSPRRRPRPSTKVTCRKGSLGLGPNYAAALLDVSDSGTRLLLKTEMQPGQEVQVSYIGPTCVREVVRNGFIIWSLPTADGSYCVGIEFEKRLEYATLLDLSRLL